MTTIASLSMSVDGFVAGPDDRPGQGLGVGGERLHHRVFGGPWTYDGERDPDAVPGEDEAYYDGLIERIGSGVVGPGRYDAAGTWGGENPFPGPLIVLRTAPATARRPPPSSTASIRRCGLAREAAGDEDVRVPEADRQAVDVGAAPAWRGSDRWCPEPVAPPGTEHRLGQRQLGEDPTADVPAGVLAAVAGAASLRSDRGGRSGDRAVSVQAAVLGFAVVALLLTVTPGLDTALVLHAAVTRGRRHAFATALGVVAGVLAWGTAAAVGVSALLTASSVAYDVLRLVGAGYLVWLGGRVLWRLVSHRAEAAAGSAPVAPRGAWRSARTGLLTNLLNPKVGAFYVAVLPQFLPAGTPALPMGVLLALVHAALSLIWFTVLVLGAVAVRRWLSARRSAGPSRASPASPCSATACGWPCPGGDRTTGDPSPGGAGSRGLRTRGGRAPP